ncbi:MAG TPA: DUF6519 domain-containing protein, partial [Burkholderiales bacterium]|nr:DUF6519 domain-containing protein [Burkholderiales bacterium]
RISAGRIYVDGLLCELDATTTYTRQPYYPNPDFTAPVASPPASPPGAHELSLSHGHYLVYLDAWQREITALDDPRIREVALGGPDTAARLQTVWQVKILPVVAPVTSPPASPPEPELACETQFPEWDELTARHTGLLNARTQPPEDSQNPCLLPPSAGYLRLENQLYRVEVHNSGDRESATFKWSRDNAIVETRVLSVSGSVLTLSEIGKDEVLSFHPGEWVELVTEEATLKSAPLPLMQIDSVDPDTREVTLKGSMPVNIDVASLKLRRWDQGGASATANGIATAAGEWIDLEGGIQVHFSAGSFRAGDYWLVPARTATGEIEWPPYAIPNTNPEPRPPLGIHHHYCRLALIEVTGSAIELKIDCRKRFPTLTDICAEDVCFDNGNCKLPQAETVQQALDRLCAARDLRHHNKHLHGWGIVCGLQVQCGPNPPREPRRQVTVHPGYAIDCEGNDIMIEEEARVDVLAGLTSPLGSPPGVGDGEVALFIETDPKGRHRLRLEPYTPPKNQWQSLLQGTLLMDFIEECIFALSDFFRAEFTPGTDEANRPVGPARKRFTTLLNLTVQLFNSTNGSFVFLSREEDKILRDFYSRLRAKLQSHTFCAMFEGARPFPDRYPFPQHEIFTIFGKGEHQRLRIAPNSQVGYGVGGMSNRIAVYDLRRNEMAVELEFPGGSNALVQDIAFSRDGRELYAMATLNNKDSVFAVADVSGLNHVWREPKVICDVLLVTLGTAPSVSNEVYAIGKGKGLYQINPQNVNATP